MECKEFHLWLRTRDIRNNPDSPETIAHRAGCIDCQQLYILDTKAEQEICLAFTSREIPRNLADRIDLCLNFETDPTTQLL